MKIAMGWAALALLAGCGGGDSSGVTAEESQQLNEAAAMLDAEPGNGAVGDETGLGTETGDVLVAGNAATNTQ